MMKINSLEKILYESKEYIKKGNVAQASEKIYKCVEGCIKILAEKNNLPEYEEAKKEGRWWAHLLGRATRSLSIKLKEEKISQVWGITYDLHVWGFHENKYNVREVKYALPYGEWLLNYTKNSYK